MAFAAGLIACGPAEPPPPNPPTRDEAAAATATQAAEAAQRWAAIAARVDPHVDKPRVIVMTDIAN